MPQSKLLIGLVTLGLTLIGVAGYAGLHRTGQAAETPAHPVTVPVSRGLVQQTVTAPGQVVGVREMVVGPAVAGRLAEITVQPGEQVQVGQMLATLDPTPLKEALAATQLDLAVAEAERAQHLAAAELALKIAEARHSEALARLPDTAAAAAALRAGQAALDDLLAGPGQDELTLAAAELRQSEAALRQAQRAYDEIAYVADVGQRPEALQLEEATLAYEAQLAAYNLAVQGASEAELAETTARVAQAQAELDTAAAASESRQQELTILQLEIEQARLALAHLHRGVDPRLAEAVAQAERDLAGATLTAPFTGVVLAVRATPGQQVTAESEIMLLADPAAVEIQVKVIEEDLPLIQVGQPVELFFDAQPVEAVPGLVSRILPQRIPGEDRPLYTVTLTPETVPPGIVAGMTADASIIIARRPAVLRLPRALVQPNSQGIAVVKVWQNGQAGPHEILVGLRGDVYVEVVAGLAEGDEIVGE